MLRRLTTSPGVPVGRRRFSQPGPTLTSLGALAALFCGASLTGAAIAIAPDATLGTATAALCVLTAFVAPRWTLAPLLVGATAIVPILILSPSPVASLAGGQARVVAAFAAVAMLRSFLGPRPPRLPVLGIRLIGAYLALVIFTTVVGLLVSNVPATQTLGDAGRHLTYLLAIGIGFVAAYGVRQRGGATLDRSIALIAIALAALSLAYWMWINQRAAAGPAAAVFDLVQRASSYPGRSIFPFAQDSPNPAALIFVAIAAFVGPRLAFSRSRLDQSIALLLILLTIAAVVSTESRTGLFAAIAAVVPLVVLLPRRRARLGVVLAGGATAALVYISAGPLFLAERGLIATAGTFGARQAIWSQAIDRIQERPAFGHGYGYAAAENFVEPATIGGAPETRLQSVHSQYLAWLVDGGVVGAVLLGAVILLVVLLVRRLLQSPESRPTGMATACLFSALGVGMVDTTIGQSAVLMSLIWLFVGIALGCLTVRSGVPQARRAYRDVRPHP